jgi:hypothetical protein
LSDTVQRVAALYQEEGLDNVPARYEAFVERCVTNVWPGWSYENHDYQQEQEQDDGTTSLKPLVDTTTAPPPPPPDAAAGTKSSSSEDEDAPPCSPLLEASYQQEDAAQTKVYNTTSSAGASGGPHFGGGVVTGVILTGALWAYMTVRQKKKTVPGGKRKTNKSYETVEMVAGDSFHTLADDGTYAIT